MINFSQESFAIADLRTAFGCFPSGVTAMCAKVDEEPVGMAASSFASVSINPPLVSVCIQNSSRTWRLLRDKRRLGLSILSGGQDFECRQLSLQDGDRFDGVEWDSTAEGAVFIVGSVAYLNCAIHTVVPAGDHAIALFRLHGLKFNAALEPLVFHGSTFRKLTNA